MSFPDPVDVAKIAALLRKNEGWYETIDEAYELLVKSDEYCKAVSYTHLTLPTNREV